MFFTFFSQFFLWFLRNNITILRYIIIVLTHFFFLRDFCIWITRNRIAEWLIPFVRKTHQARHSYVSPRTVIVTDENITDFLDKYLINFSDKSSIAYFDTSKVLLNQQIKDKINKFTYGDHIVFSDVTTVRNSNIDQWEIENKIIQANNFFIFGNDGTQVQLRNLLIQYSLKRPYQLYFLPHSLNKNLCYSSAILTELSLGYVYAPVAQKRNSKKTKTTVAWQLVPNTIISCKDTNQVDDEKRKQVLFDILINSFDSLLTDTVFTSCKSQSGLIIKSIMNFISNPDINLSRQDEFLNLISFMAGTSYANAPLGLVNLLFNILKSNYTDISRYTRFIIFWNLLKWVDLDENKNSILYKKIEEIITKILQFSEIKVSAINDLIEKFNQIAKFYQIPSKVYLSKSVKKSLTINSITNSILADINFLCNQNYFFKSNKQIKKLLSTIIVVS